MSDKPLHLWLLEREQGHRDNRANALVVRAATEGEAREMARAAEYERASYGYREEPARHWLDPEYTSCAPLAGDGEAGVVAMDFYEP